MKLVFAVVTDATNLIETMLVFAYPNYYGVVPEHIEAAMNQVYADADRNLTFEWGLSSSSTRVWVRTNPSILLATTRTYSPMPILGSVDTNFDDPDWRELPLPSTGVKYRVLYAIEF